MAGARAPSARWRDALEAWTIPPEILSQAPASPWGFPPRLFAAGAADALVDSPSNRLARAELAGGGTVLDVGCGGGRSSVPLASVASSVTGVDEQPGMLANFAAVFEQAGVPHREVRGRWPEVATDVEEADVVICHHVVYNVAAIEPFVETLTHHARRRVVVELSERHPMSPLAPLWQHFWGLDRPHGPSAEVFVEIVETLGHEIVVERVIRPPRQPTLDDPTYVQFVRRRLCLGPARDGEVAAQSVLLGSDPHDATVTVSWRIPAGEVSSRW